MTIYGYVPSPLKGDSYKEEATTTPKESVNHPEHYQGKGIEVIDIIEAFDLNFSLGNAIKYILRADKKGNRKQDLEKARWYLNREITKSI